MNKLHITAPNQPLTTKFIWNPGDQSFQAKENNTPRQDGFIKGPLPLSWFVQAAALPGKALHVAMAIWFQVGLERQQTIKLGQKRVQRFSVSRDAKYDALMRLEKIGLIGVERLPGQAPIVTVLE